MSNKMDVAIEVVPGFVTYGENIGRDSAGRTLVRPVGHKTQKNASHYYAGRFLRLDCYRDLHKIFSRTSDPIKEMTEVWTFWEAIKKKLELDPKSENISAIVIGDGVTPRLGAFLAHMTKWSITSMDPAFEQGRNHVDWSDVRGMTTFDFSMEEVVANFGSTPWIQGQRKKNVLLLFPHAHASAEFALEHFHSKTGRTSMISMPCCEYATQRLVRKPDFEYRDTYCLSDKNEVLIWDNL